MGDVVNLNRFRKQRERSSTSQRGVESRVRAGRAKAERQAARAEATPAALSFWAAESVSNVVFAMLPPPPSVGRRNRDGCGRSASSLKRRAGLQPGHCGSNTPWPKALIQSA